MSALGTYYLVTIHGTIRRHTDLARALIWFDQSPRATHLIGPTGMTVADRRRG